LRAVFVSIVFMGLTTSLAGAALIDGLSFEHFPRVRATSVMVNYDPDGGTNGRGLLTFSGFTTEYYHDELNPTSFDDIDGDFYLRVEIDKTSLQAVSGSLTPLAVDDFYGYANPPNYDAPPLEALFESDTSEEPIDFGYGGSGLFQFLFKQTGSGMLAPVGSTIGVIVDATGLSSGTFGGDFQSDFSNGGIGFSNIFYLPEPTTMQIGRAHV